MKYPPPCYRINLGYLGTTDDYSRLIARDRETVHTAEVAEIVPMLIHDAMHTHEGRVDSSEDQ